MRDPKHQPWKEPDLDIYRRAYLQNGQVWTFAPAARPFTPEEYIAFKMGIFSLYERDLERIGSAQFTKEMIDELPYLHALINELRDIDGASQGPERPLATSDRSDMSLDPDRRLMRISA